MTGRVNVDIFWILEFLNPIFILKLDLSRNIDDICLFIYFSDERTTKIYEPISLWDIQRLVDLGRLDPTQIIDITAIINARLMTPSEWVFEYYI